MEGSKAVPSLRETVLQGAQGDVRPPESAAMEATSGCAATGQRQGQTRAGGSRPAGRAAGPRASVTGPCSGERWDRKREGDAGHSPARRSCSSPWRPRVSAPGVPARHPLSATPPPGRRCGEHGGRHEESAGEVAGTAGPGQTSTAAPEAPPRRPLILLPPQRPIGEGAGPKGRGLEGARSGEGAASSLRRGGYLPPPRPPRAAAASGVMMAAGLRSRGRWPG